MASITDVDFDVETFKKMKDDYEKHLKSLLMGQAQKLTLRPPTGHCQELRFGVVSNCRKNKEENLVVSLKIK